MKLPWGSGGVLVRPLARGLARRWVLLGTLPDLLDKALYYALRLGTGRVGADLGIVTAAAVCSVCSGRLDKRRALL